MLKVNKLKSSFSTLSIKTYNLWVLNHLLFASLLNIDDLYEFKRVWFQDIKIIYVLCIKLFFEKPSAQIDSKIDLWYASKI